MKVRAQKHVLSLAVAFNEARVNITWLWVSVASSARDYLVAKGVNAARVRIISYGKERPASVGSTEAAWREPARTDCP